MVRKLWHSPDCTRSAQHCGKEASDLMGGPPALHIEVKRRKALAVYDFYDQAVMDAKDGETPVVLMRENDRGWLVMFAMEDTDAFCKAIEGAKADVAA
jgi:hypothetical protein